MFEAALDWVLRHLLLTGAVTSTFTIGFFVAYVSLLGNPHPITAPAQPPGGWQPPDER